MSNPIKKAFDNQLSGIQLDESKLHKARPNPGRPLKRALILAAALVIVAGAAFSASQFLGTINWEGKKTPVEAAPTPAPQAPQEELDEQIRLERAAFEALKRKPTEELWLAKAGPGWTSFFPKVLVNSLEEGRKLIEGSASPLKLPGSIPSSFAFNNGEFNLYIDEKNDGRLKSLGDESPDEGLMLRGFRLPDDALSDFSGYNLHFVNKHGESLHLEARMSSGNEEFGLWQGESHKALSIPGFENVLLFDRGSMWQIFAQQADFSPVSVCRMDYFTDSRTMEGYTLEPETYTSITYILRGNKESLSESDFIKLAESYFK